MSVLGTPLAAARGTRPDNLFRREIFLREIKKRVLIPLDESIFLCATPILYLFFSRDSVEDVRRRLDVDEFEVALLFHVRSGIENSSMFVHSALDIVRHAHVVRAVLKTKEVGEILLHEISMRFVMPRYIRLACDSPNTRHDKTTYRVLHPLRTAGLSGRVILPQQNRTED